MVALAGAGGVGSVYRAHDLATGATVALKLLHRDSEGEARFAREAAVLASLLHGGIVRYLDYGMAEGNAPYLVMEWLVGEDLDARLRRGPLDVGEALLLARAVADALAALTAGHARLAAVASRIASPERRRRFWARRLPNDRIHTFALAWGLATDA